MIWFMIGHLFSTLLEWLSIGRLSEQEKDLEILLLRQQLVILERKLDKPILPSRIEKLTIAVVAAKLKATTKYSTTQRGRSFVCSNPKRFCDGIATWSVGSGRIAMPNGSGDHGPATRLRDSSSVSCERMRIGAMAKSKARSASWATTSGNRRLPICWNGTASPRNHSGARRPVGGS